MNIQWNIVLIPIISAFIGWATNYIAVKMIFRPHKAIGVGPFRLQGVIPRRQPELAEKVGEVVSRDLVSHHDLAHAIDSEPMRREILRILETRVDGFISHKLTANPMIAMFLQGSVVDNIKKSLKEEIESSLPEVMESVRTRFEAQADLQGIVTQKVANFELTTLEGIIQSIAAKELRTIELLGGVLGFIIGLGQIALLQITP